jgi:protein AF-17/10
MKQDEANTLVINKNSSIKTTNSPATTMMTTTTQASLTTSFGLNVNSTTISTSAADLKLLEDEKQMVGGCCVCADDSGYSDNQLVYCDGHECLVAVHQGCYGIITVPEGNWYCKVCEFKLNATTSKENSTEHIVIKCLF